MRHWVVRSILSNTFRQRRMLGSLSQYVTHWSAVLIFLDALLELTDEIPIVLSLIIRLLYFGRFHLQVLKLSLPVLKLSIHVLKLSINLFLQVVNLNIHLFLQVSTLSILLLQVVKLNIPLFLQVFITNI